VIRIWNVATGEMVKELRGHERTIWCLAWHPSGKRLASGSEDMTVRIWEPFEGQHLLTLKGPTDDVRSLSFSPDGRYLASSCDDRFVRIWDATPLDLVTTDD
jgi:WD40 repeat protein